MLTTEQIRTFIDRDRMSTKKRLAKIGANYYEGNHDIKDYKLYYYNEEGILVEDTTRSNIKISHPFFTELIDQKIQYQFSGDGYFVKSKDPTLQAYLDEQLNENEDFKAEFEAVATDASVNGFGYLFLYVGKDGNYTFQCADSMGVVEVRAKDTDDNCEYVIYWYIDRITEDNKRIKKIQVWDATQVWYYTQVNEGKIELDQDDINPRPHSVYTVGINQEKKGESFGFIPFFRLDNNRKQISDLKTIKDLIDDYDLMACGLSNNIQDASEYVVIVKGYEGTNLDELDQNLRTKKRISVGEGGDLDFKTVSIPVDARKAKLELDEKNIYRFGMGFNSAQLGDGNITNIVIKSRYALLDLKCNKFETNLRKLLRQIVKVYIEKYNLENKANYSIKDVYFEFEREVMTNALDNATIEKTEAETRQVVINYLLSLAATLDNETIVEAICECLDIEYDEIKDKLPVNEEEEANEAENILNNVPVDNEDNVPNGGGVA